MPTLYCSRSIIVNEKLKHRSISNKLRIKPCFSNSILQNIACGHTMIFNQKARELYNNLKIPYDFLIPHDWLMYILVSGVNGKIIFDESPSVLYRQHDANAIGYFNFKNKYFNFKNNLYKKYIENIIELVELNKNIFNNDNVRLINDLNAIIKTNLLKKLYFFFKNKIFKQTFFQNMLLIFLISMNRI